MSGTITPASPCIGSTIKAAVLGSLIASSSEFKLLYFINSKPGKNGPNPSKLLGSLLDEIAANVLPQKLPLAKTTLALFFSTPFTS